jgi:tetratricopeptide (TPR) repeat protein
VQSVLEARRIASNHCPVVAALHLNLLTVYLYLDPLGYADDIREAIAYTENHLTDDPMLLTDLKIRHAMLELESGSYDRARHLALEGLNLSSEDSQIRSGVYGVLALTAYKQHDLALALRYAEMGENLTRPFGESLQLLTLQYLGYRAWFSRALGDEEMARSLLRHVQGQRQHMSAEPYLTYYEALCRYHQVAAEWNEAISYCQQAIDYCIRRGMVYAESQARGLLCLLHCQAGRPFSDEMGAARKAAARLRKPERLLALLSSLEQGDCHEG